MNVMKFGGTSVADQAAIERLIAIVRAARQAAIQPESADWRGPVVVVSALGGATDRLLGVAAEAGAGDVEGAREQRPRAARAPPRSRAASSPTTTSARDVERFIRARVRRARAHRRRARRAARSVAALARRDRRDRRDPQQPHRRGRADVARPGRRLGRRAPGHRHRRPSTRRAAPLVAGDDGGAAGDGRSAAGRAADSGHRRLRRRHARRA